MPTYFDTLTAAQKSNIKFIVQRMNEKGITNPLTQSAILAVVSKESAFIPKSEDSYRNTANDRIRKIFGSRVSQFDEAGLTALKSNDEAFFNAVYGLPRFGQTANEGYKYRGRGLNQITFKSLYKKLGTLIGLDLVNNPDRVNELPVATDCLIHFFLDSFKTASADKLAAYNTPDINGFKSTRDSVGAVYNANSGWGTPKSTIDSDPTGGRAKAESRVDGFALLINTMA
jgi:predicted chitinase